MVQLTIRLLTGRFQVRILVAEPTKLENACLSAYPLAGPRLVGIWRIALALAFATLLFAAHGTASFAQTASPGDASNTPAAGGHGKLTSGIAFDRIALGSAFDNVEAYAILQDDEGMIWFGTSDGLTRYDGYTRVSYVHDPADPTSIAGGVTALAQDQRIADWLWLGTAQGLERFDRRTHQFTAYGADSTAAVQVITQSPSGLIWLGTDNGLASFDPSTSTVALDARVTTPIRAMYLEDSGRLWVGGDDGVARLDTSGAVTYHMDPDDPNSMLGKRVNAIEPDGRGNLWIGTDLGLNHLNTATDVFTRYAPTRDDPTSLSNVWVDSLAYDRSGTLWIGTHSGLDRLDAATGTFVSYFNDPLDSNSLGNNFVNVVYVDRTGMIWIGPRNTDVDKFQPDRQFFELWQPGRGVQSVAFGHDGVLWLASNGLERYEIATGQTTVFTHDPSNPNSLGDDNIEALLEDRDGIVWIGTVRRGLDRFDPATGMFRHYLAGPTAAGLQNNEVSALFEDRVAPHILWIGTSGGGLTRLDTSSGIGQTYVHEPLEPDSLAGNEINGIAQDPAGAIWIATTTGLSRWDAASGRFVSYRANADTPNSLTSSNVRFIDFAADGTLWIATAGGGLNHFDPRTGTATAFSQHEGLPYYSIRAMQSDVDGNLWLANEGWVARFDPRTQTIRSFDRRQGIRSGTEFPFGAAARGADGRIFFGSDKGLITFLPDEVMAKTSVPPVVLTDFQLYGRSVDIGADSPLKQAIDRTTSLTLPYSDQVFGFSFAALDYEDPGHIRYAYRMEGLSDAWVDVDSSVRSATFIGLAPGNYVFHVKATNSDGIWNDSGSSIAVTITPPWWETLWFRGFAVAALVLLVFAAYRLRIRAVEARTRDLEAQVAARTAELARASEAKSEFLANMSHELRTPLNSILGYAQVLQRGDTHTVTVRTGLQTIYQSGRHLLTLIDDLLDLARIEARRVQLRPTDVSLDQLVADISIMVQPTMREKGLEFTNMISGDVPEYVHVDAVRLRQVLLNLLGNALKFTDRGSVTLLVDCHTVDRSTCSVCFSVSDTGTGISDADRERIFQRFEQVNTASFPRSGAGLGLALSQELVQLLGGRINLASELGRGSTFSFELQLPAVAGSSTRRRPSWQRIGGYAGARRTILVADDAMDSRALMRDLLEPLGFAVVVAESGPAAVHLARQISPDLIIADPIIGNDIRLGLQHERTPIVAVPEPIEADQLLEVIASLLQLEWTYADDGHRPSVIEGAGAEMVAPPDDELERLSQLARFGNMRRLAERAQYLETLDAVYAPFAHQLGILVRDLQDDEIVLFIDRFRQQRVAALVGQV